MSNSYFSLFFRLTRTELPQDSLIYEYHNNDIKQYQDYWNLFDSQKVIVNLDQNQKEKLSQFTNQQIQTRYIQAFFRQPVFQIERFLLGLVGSSKYKTTDEDILKSKFQVVEQDGCSMFRLKERKNSIIEDVKQQKNLEEKQKNLYDEAMFEWDKDVGRTWLMSRVLEKQQIQENQLQQEVNKNNQQQIELYFGSGLRMPQSRKTFLFDKILVPFHELYSRILLAGAGSQFCKDLNNL